MSRIAFGPRAGQKVLTVQGAMPRAMVFDRTLCADIDGVALHTVARCRADGRKALERLCRDIARASAGQLTRANQRRREGGAQAEDSLG